MNEDRPSALESLMKGMRPGFQNHLRSYVQSTPEDRVSGLSEMLSYQLGWEGVDAGPKARGKQIRPMLLLLAVQAGGEGWQKALPAACAVELLHNFSLIHDDIQDESPTRRGRPTVWKKWGRAQAINAGDAMFTLANQSLLELENTLSPQVTLKSCRVFQRACYQLTQGQYLDLNFEERDDISIQDYWRMVHGKTAALLGGAMEIGAICARVDLKRQRAFRDFGLNLGLAFQNLDDILGIWGEKEETGKSNKSDLLTGKKTLPILYGMANSKRFRSAWSKGNRSPQHVPEMARILKEDGARDYAQGEANRLTDAALNALTNARPSGDAGTALRELAERLLQRRE